MNLLSVCCGQPLTWALHVLTVGPVGKPVGYDALCSGCERWVVSIPIEEASRVRLDRATCHCGDPADPSRIHTDDVPCYDVPKKP